MNTIMAALLTLLPHAAHAQTDTLHLSHLYTTHIRFETNLSYVDLSNPRVMSALIPDQNKNVLAIKATAPFTSMASLTAIEESGRMVTFYVVYDENPKELIMDAAGKERVVPDEKGPIGDGQALSVSSRHDVATTGRGKAPTVQSVLKMKRGVYHVSDRQYGVRMACENVYVYSDVIYFVLSLENGSGISYQSGQPTFMMESARKNGGRRGRRRSVVNDGTIVMPKSVSGSLSSPAGQTSRMALCFDKLTLAKGQVLGIYLYENGGKRNLHLKLNAREINRAKSLDRK